MKVTGGLDHGGEDVLKADSTGYRILADFVRRVNVPAPAGIAAELTADDKNAPPFFEGVAMLDDAPAAAAADAVAGRSAADCQRRLRRFRARG